MSTEIVFETHSVSEDNERDIASGWQPGKLSGEGRKLARDLGKRRRDDGIAAVFASDLLRAVQTAEIAFRSSPIPILHDWRLRECNYGDMNGAPHSAVHGNRLAYLDVPYPNGESWRQAARRVERFLDDLPLRWDGRRVIVIGHVATRTAFDHYLKGVPLEQALVAQFEWQPGWEYVS